jgi:signal transduction histidine kinase
MDENKLNIEAYPFSLYKVIKDSFKSVVLEARKKHVELVNIVNKNMPPLLIGDPCRIKQILINLLSNAIKFSDSGIVDVSSSCVLLEERDQYLVTVKVKDSGQGIPEDEQQLLFHPFSQTSCGKKKGGSGLGLFISKKLAQRMGGDMWFDSVRGVGSSFYFSFVTRIPEQPETKVDDVVPTENTTTACTDNEHCPEEPSFVTAQNKTLQKIVNLRYLIAEDNVVNKFLVRKLLKLLGCVHVKS